MSFKHLFPILLAYNKNYPSTLTVMNQATEFLPDLHHLISIIKVGKMVFMSKDQIKSTYLRFKHQQHYQEDKIKSRVTRIILATRPP